MIALSMTEGRIILIVRPKRGQFMHLFWLRTFGPSPPVPEGVGIMVANRNLGDSPKEISAFSASGNDVPGFVGSVKEPLGRR
jgi:hypothetical protein